MKRLNLLGIWVLGSMFAASNTYASTETPKVAASLPANNITIVNNIAPIQIGATVYDNGGKPGNPTINIFTSSDGSGGATVTPNNSYPTYVANGSSATLGVQINSARIPSGGGQCDQLCGHITVAISADGSTCTAQNSAGSCGSNLKSPTWTANLTASMNSGMCTVSLNSATTPPIVCGCQWGSYPCASNVTCGPGTKNPTCPAKPPYQW
ncbi:MAG: hypothetical protein NTZ67_06065 [Gammaproteobacteria bacterium]|nr:hypothetical protein [Gammaproteobacteria bacterium]